MFLCTALAPMPYCSLQCILGVVASLSARCMQVESTAKSVLGLYQRALASADLLPSDKEDLSARACTFADMCGSADMQEAAERLHAARWGSTSVAPYSSNSWQTLHSANVIAFAAACSCLGAASVLPSRKQLLPADLLHTQAWT